MYCLCVNRTVDAPARAEGSVSVARSRARVRRQSGSADHRNKRSVLLFRSDIPPVQNSSGLYPVGNSWHWVNQCVQHLSRRMFPYKSNPKYEIGVLLIPAQEFENIIILF